MLHDISRCDTNTKSHMEDVVLHDINIRDTNIKSPMEETMLHDSSPRNINNQVTYGGGNVTGFQSS